ncbi:MAG: ligase-associated DNA damage response DEXH box helicase [Phycisphaerales bacterium]
MSIAKGRTRRKGTPTGSPGVRAVTEWFQRRGWSPWGFQTETWEAYAAGKSGLIQVATGAGKTYAAVMGPIAEAIDDLEAAKSLLPSVRVVYVTPLRAVSRDIELAIKLPIDEMSLPLLVESRTGDTKASVRQKQKLRLPHVLVTTPESLCLLLAREDAARVFGDLRCLILDEWHELLASKRGSQVELAAARLRAISPRLRTWALSATLANLHDAAACAAGIGGDTPAIVTGDMRRPISLRTVFPNADSRLPWVGHMGLGMLPAVVDAIDLSKPTILFTNTRSQSERWFSALLVVRPEWAPLMALHHGSIDREERERVEAGLKSGELRLVVATSSLDLGIDFSPVERVIQVGSPKGIARLMQRAGRAAHRPNATTEILCVPTYALELLEIAAARDAIARGEIEARRPYERPLDVLSQHLVTVGLGDGFEPDRMFDEVRTAFSYKDLTREEFDWTLGLVTNGGGTLHAYPEYHKLRNVDGRYRVTNSRIAQVHRLNVGTITADTTLEIAYERGRRLGRIEENFVSGLRPGDRFVYAGKTLEFLGLKDLVAYVKTARGTTSRTPIWSGTRLPISESLAASVRRKIAALGRGEFDGPEVEAFRRIAEIQASLSVLPREDQVLVEVTKTSDGHHCCVFAFEGRLVNGAIGALLALRLSRRTPLTIAIAANDYGVELLTTAPMDFATAVTPELFDPRGLLDDAFASVDKSELAKAQFREIARISGLVVQSYPGARKSGRQLGVNSSLLFDVLAEFDPGNLLLAQAKREVLERQFESSRLARTLERIGASSLVVRRTADPTPFAFPIFIERLSTRLSSETIQSRIERMQVQWELDKGTCPSGSARPGRKKSSSSAR